MLIVLPDGREFRFSDDISEAQAQAIVRTTLAAESVGKESQDKAKELAAASEALARAEAAVTESIGRVTSLTASADALSGLGGAAESTKQMLTALNAKIDTIATQRPTIVAKAAPVSDNSAAVVAALVELRGVMAAGFDKLFKAQMADTVLRPDEYGDLNKSVKVIR